MVYRKRTRTPMRRARRKFKRSKKTSLVTKSYLRKALVRTKESKSVSTLTEGLSIIGGDSPLVNDITSYNIFSYITPGVTDAGRIGNTIELSAVGVKWISNSGCIPGTESLTNRYRDVHLHVYLVMAKNNYLLPQTYWYNAFNRGAETPYVALNTENIGDGRRTINTSQIKILGHKRIKLGQPNNNTLEYQRDGTILFKCKKTVKINSNSTDANGNAECNPPIYLIMYLQDPGTQLDSGPFLSFQNVQVSTSITTYYKD